MIEPTPPPDAPEHIVQLILGSMQFSDACLRIYGHPQLLAVAAQINGEDFAPFNEAVWMKHPGLGPSVTWHQDGTTHWDSSQLDQGSHGFNFMAQVYGCTAANGVWVVPGSHKHGKIDIKALVEAAGFDRLPDAVPMVCDPGDVVMCNRQALHGSFANTSADTRVTINFRFHRRASVLGVEGAGIRNQRVIYDDARIRERSRLIGLASIPADNGSPMRNRTSTDLLSERKPTIAGMRPPGRDSKTTTCWISAFETLDFRSLRNSESRSGAFESTSVRRPSRNRFHISR